jgi:hypothetical protein
MSLKENLLSKLSYTSRDYESIMKDLINILKSDDTFKVKNWDNLSEADPLFIILSLMAAHTDILNYMIDYRILENYMSTAKERASLVRIANSVGYKIRSFRPAYATFKVTKNSSTPTTLELEPLGNQFTDGSRVGWVYAGPTRKLTAEDLTNGTYLGFVQGTIATLDILPSEISNRTHIISNMQVAIGSNIDNTITSRLETAGAIKEVWTEVESVLGKTGQVYELNVDPLGTTYIRFPLDFDPIKYTNSKMTLTYLVTNGFETQVQPPSISNPSLLNFTFERGTDSIFVYGSNPATTDEIREGYKMYMYSGDSLISLADIKNYILNIQKLVPGIKKCLVIDSTLDTGFGEGSAEFAPGCFGVFVLKDNNIQLTEGEGSELSLLQADIDAKKPAGTKASIANPEKKLIKIKLKPRLSEQADANFIKSIIKEYVNNKEIGESLSAGEIFELIFSVRPKLYSKGLVVELLEEPPVTTYLTFQSDSSFDLKVYDNTKHWDGTLYYSTDLETWYEWDGTTLSSVNNKLYLRGTGNTVITGDSQDYRWVLTGSNIKCIGNIENLLDWEAVESGDHPSMASHCYAHLFQGCTALVSAPALPATTLANYCYYNMFYGCTSLKISSTQTEVYQYEWRIPTSGTGTPASDWNANMLSGTSGTFTSDPSINTAYYVENPPEGDYEVAEEDEITLAYNQYFDITAYDISESE